MAKVTFIGLGVMGYPMAGYIAKGGHDVTVYNRTIAKAEKWAKEFGGKHAATPKEAAKDSDFVFSCVGNDNDLREVTIGEHGAFHSVKENAQYLLITPPHLQKLQENYIAKQTKENLVFLMHLFQAVKLVLKTVS
jgi:3-hydroxyisobutyrate dehydrogenase and related beta-hydroxyacid dehydrogenases